MRCVWCRRGPNDYSLYSTYCTVTQHALTRLVSLPSVLTNENYQLVSVSHFFRASNFVQQ